jgi:GDP-4-dehydro-6-deoxy-D-mannose reductase
MTDIKNLLIDPENMEPYMSHFKDYEEEMKKNLVNEKFWKEKRILITGVSGFVGSHLADKLTELGAETYGFVRRHSVPEYQNINHLKNKINLIEGNFLDMSSIMNAIKQSDPHIIFHLGAQSFVPTSFRCPIETIKTNTIGTSNVLEAMRKTENNIEKIQLAMTSEEYGLVKPEECPVNENNPLRPMSPYGSSKIAAEYIARTYYKAYGTPIVITRGFNHTGPRRGLQFVASVIARQVASCIINKTNEITLGHGEAVRDFTDVRDMIQGYMLAVEKAKLAEPYNFGHGFGITINNLAKLTGKIHNMDIKINTDKSRFRPSEVELLICDYSKAKKELGYRPRIPINKTMLDLVEYFKQNKQLLNLERH